MHFFPCHEDVDNWKVLAKVYRNREDFPCGLLSAGGESTWDSSDFQYAMAVFSRLLY